MDKEKSIELLRQAGITTYVSLETVATDKASIQRFAELVRAEALEEAADALYGNGLDMDVMIELRQQIRSLKCKTQ